MSEHVHWASLTSVGIFFLLAPFVLAALICAGVQQRAQDRSAVAIFGAAMVTLLYFYFGGFQAAQHALLEERWTAAALSIGLLPFFVAIPVLLAVAVAGAAASKFDRRREK